MKITSDFFNKTAKVIDKKYFPDVKYYGDNKKCADVHYALELFNNGCLTYPKLISRVAKNCNDTQESIHNIVKDFVEDFEGYVFSFDVCYIEYLNKEKGLKKDKKFFSGANAFKNAVLWGRKNLENFHIDMIR